MANATRDMKIKMLIEYTPYSKDDVVTMDIRKARVLIDTGVAIKYVPKGQK